MSIKSQDEYKIYLACLICCEITEFEQMLKDNIEMSVHILNSDKFKILLKLRDKFKEGL